MIKFRFRTAFCGIFVAICLSLWGCGGGGGGSTETAAAKSSGTNNPPAGSAPLTIDGNPSTSITEGLTYSFTPSVNGGNGGSQSFSISNMPSWASFDSTTGALTGTPGTGDIGMVSTGIVISVDDGQDSASLPAFEITVLASSLGSATLSWTAPTENEDSSPLTDLAGYTVYYGTSIDDYPNSVTIYNPGITTNIVENLSTGTWHFIVTAFDLSGNESAPSNIVSLTIT